MDAARHDLPFGRELRCGALGRNSNHGAKHQIMREAQIMAQPIHPGGSIVADNLLVDLSKTFAVDIINLCDAMQTRGKATSVISQLLRSGTSIGANIHEANYASSKADFIHKFQIALKECYETDYWLDVFHGAGILTADEYDRAFSQCSKLRKLLIASITTAKNNNGQ